MFQKDIIGPWFENSGNMALIWDLSRSGFCPEECYMNSRNVTGYFFIGQERFEAFLCGGLSVTPLENFL